MALPPAFLDDLRSRLTLSDVAGRKVMWDQRKSNPAKGDFWAPCPFHQEKTPSFHVDDRKGFYYCFGCHAKGDMITFVKDTDNVSFIEAVEILAREAGVEMPQQSRDPQAAERRERSQILADVMEQAVKAFGLAFRSAAAAPVREYCQGRGLAGETAKRFEIGFAPDSRTHLTAMFREKNLLDEAIACGLVIKGDDGATYDRFRNRLMFPIRDPRGRCIAFGGRAMDPNARAKYLNSPETELFHKSRVLYNHGPAREAAGKTQALIVAEGYMDVIALAQAGFGHAVAPLGTAVTEDQLGLMWRIADEPVIALDGDKAGLRAAERLVDLALPMLAPGKSLRFCLMPEGLDPDDLIKAEGPGAMQTALDNAVPLIEMLWRRETAEPHDTPERRAALDQRLKTALNRIADAGVRNHYAAELRARRAALFQPPANAARGLDRGGWQPSRGSGKGFPRRPQGPVPTTRASQLSRTTTDLTQARVRESGILTGILLQPGVLRTVEGALEDMRFLTPDLSNLRDDILALAGVAPEDLRGCLADRLGRDPMEGLTNVSHLAIHPLSRRDLEAEHVRDVILDAITRHEATLTAETERSDARAALPEATDENWTRRLLQAQQEKQAADNHASTALKDSVDEREESVFQRMLDDGTWRRRR